MDVLIAATERDARAASAIVDHHAEMSGALAAKVEALIAAATQADNGRVQAARQDLVKWCSSDLVPHALAEESSMYPAAQASDEGRLLVGAMIDEHRVIVDLVGEIEHATEGVRAAAAARALKAMFDSHLAKENEKIIPLLARIPGASIGDVLDQMHESLDARKVSDAAKASGPDGAASADATGSGHAGGACACGGTDEPGFPELDVQTIPHAIRHATIFGALDAVRAGSGLVISANHDPVPLLAQLQQRAPGAFEIEYLERGPERWKLQFVRGAASSA